MRFPPLAEKASVSQLFGRIEQMRFCTTYLLECRRLVGQIWLRVCRVFSLKKVGVSPLDPNWCQDRGTPLLGWLFMRFLNEACLGIGSLTKLHGMCNLAPRGKIPGANFDVNSHTLGPASLGQVSTHFRPIGCQSIPISYLYIPHSYQMYTTFIQISNTLYATFMPMLYIVGTTLYTCHTIFGLRCHTQLAYNLYKSDETNMVWKLV